MTWPWMSRRAHEELVAELRREISDRKEEARKIMDLFTQRATGQKIFYPDVEPEAKPVEIENESELAMAKRAVGPKGGVRQILNHLEKSKEKEFKQVCSTAAAYADAEAEEAMNKAMKDGRAAVTVNG